MRSNDKIPISKSVLSDAMGKAQTNKSRLARETGMTLRTVQRCFTEQRASTKTILLLCKALDLSPALLMDENNKAIVGNETYKQWEKRSKEKPTIEQTRFIKAQTALSDYLNNVTISDPNGKQYHIDASLLYQHGGTLESTIKKAIAAWMDDNGYFDTGKE